MDKGIKYVNPLFFEASEEKLWKKFGVLLWL